MDWYQLGVFLISVFGLFIWNRSESRSDMRQVHSILQSIQAEIKDFHGRLCAIEERNKK